MSNDHIFAAQMWSWTDPMIKRDSHGRILIVNAAFLQLYGGSVETWTGNPIEGWPTPKSPGEISRFESRIPLPTGGETVYDWIECTHHDGTALAMARDVTAYAAKPIVQASPASPVTPTPAEPIYPEVAAANQIQEDLTSLSPLQQPAHSPAPEAAPQPSIAAEAPVTAPIQEAPVAPVQNIAADPAMLAEPAPIASPPMPTNEAPIAQPVQQTPQAEPAPVLEQATPAPQPPVEEVRGDSRAMEKRALPIENGDAILGNNWRDAVIAKAVGVEDVSDVVSVDETTEDAQAKLTSPEGGQVRVLLAEDNAINALLTRTLLEAEGCHCDVVEDGALAVEAVKNNEYHMVFMDMRMPNMDGLEATRKIRSLGYNAKILPIVALTANAFDDDRNACFDSGMNDFMTKPVSAEELSAMVKTHTSLEAEKIAS